MSDGTGAMLAGLPRRTLAIALALGAALGVAYTLSPLTVWFVVALVPIGGALTKGLGERERRVILAIFVAAILARVVVVAGLFVVTDHASVPFGSLFGDEEYFKRRSLWLRSMALDVPISPADIRYATDDYSDTSYLYLLALVQVVVGDAPYGVHLLGILFYLAAAVVLYRFMRRAFGSAPATIAFVLLLFFPSLFAWSVSALRESLHLLLTTLALVLASRVPRARRWAARGLLVAGAFVSAWLLRDLRVGSFPVTVVAAVIGVGAALMLRRLGTAFAGVAAGVAVLGLLLLQPQVENWLGTMLRATAMNHQGHAFTPGLHYKVLEPEFYVERTSHVMDSMTPVQMLKYAIRAGFALVFVPLPWQPQTTLTVAYVPEQLVWIVLVLAVPLGSVIGWRRDAAATFVLLAYVLLMGSGVALLSGNVGTLVRHRGLLLPFVICLAAVALSHLAARAGDRVAPAGLAARKDS